MRSSIVTLGLLALVSALAASAQTLTLTPQSLTAWTLTGATKEALARQAILSLPAGAQLSRTFRTGDITVAVTARPVFATAPADWPVLEVGAAALVFARTGETGQLILKVGDTEPVALPLAVTLDAAGRSADPISVTLVRSGDMLVVNLAGQTQQFPTDAAASLEIIASAGADHPWTLDSLQVTVPETATVSGTTGPKSDSGNSVPPPTGSTSTFSGRFSAASLQPAAGTNTGGSDSAKSTVASPTRPIAPEVFTPPSVRTSRVDAVRAAVAQLKNQP